MSVPTPVPEIPPGAIILKMVDFRTVTPSLLNLFSNGLNWDEVRDLEFIADTHTWGIRLLQVVRFVVAPRKLHYLSNFGGKRDSLTRLAAPQSCETYPDKQAGYTGCASALATSRLLVVCYPDLGCLVLLAVIR